MQAAIVTREPAKVVGIQVRIQPQEADYGAIWDGQFVPRQAEIEVLAVEPGYYGVYYDCGEQGLCDFLAGMAVGPVDVVPEGLALRDVPGGAYARFECTLSEIGVTWQRIMGEWLPTAAFGYDEARPSIEWYAPMDVADYGRTLIYMPVVAKP